MSEQPERPVEFPRSTNSLLSQEEKNFLDDVPDNGVKYIFDNPKSVIEISFVPKDLSTTYYYKFENDKAQAVHDYYEMLFAYGIRKDPRADAA